MLRDTCGSAKHTRKPWKKAETLLARAHTLAPDDKKWPDEEDHFDKERFAQVLRESLLEEDSRHIFEADREEIERWRYEDMESVASCKTIDEGEGLADMQNCVEEKHGVDHVFDDSISVYDEVSYKRKHIDAWAIKMRGGSY